MKGEARMRNGNCGCGSTGIGYDAMGERVVADPTNSLAEAAPLGSNGAAAEITRSQSGECVAPSVPPTRWEGPPAERPKDDLDRGCDVRIPEWRWQPGPCEGRFLHGGDSYGAPTGHAGQRRTGNYRSRRAGSEELI